MLGRETVLDWLGFQSECEWKRFFFLCFVLFCFVFCFFVCFEFKNQCVTFTAYALVSLFSVNFRSEMCGSKF